MRQIGEEDRTLVWYMLVAVRILYAKYWKSKKIPQTIEWLEKLVFHAEMDELTKKLREQNEEKFLNEWEKLKNI